MRPFPQLFDTSRFMPHGMCYLWEPGLLWTHVVSDVLIGASYLAISLTLGWLVWRSAREHVEEAGPFQRLPFWWMFVAFGLFIVACGATHLLGAWTVWNPDYWVSGGAKALTAVASLATAIALPPLIPRALALVREARTAEARKRNLEAAHAELQEANERITELDELKTRFFANVSHELRTPLTLITAPVERMLARDDLDDEDRKSLHTVLRNARTLHRHVNDLLDVTRLEVEGMHPDYGRGDLAELVRRTAMNFDGLARERDLDFTVEAAESLPAVVDPAYMERVLLNLLSNAFKFTPVGGVIRVAIGPDEDGGGARLTVADSGPGVPEPMRDVVFERFRQVEGGTGRAFAGTGLGLAIVRELVELHGGTVEIGDAPEGGAAFTVWIPLAPADGVEAPEGGWTDFTGDGGGAADLVSELLGESRVQAELQQPASTPGRSEDRALVMVVEDNPEMGRFILDVLPEEVDGVLVRDGDEALRRAEEDRPDLILSDIMMPGMSGDRLLTELRTRRPLQQVPFLALTAREDEDLRVQMLEEGAQDYVTKPFLPAELRARVANWLSVARTRRLMQTELEVSEMDLEVLARDVTRRKRELEVALESARVAREEEAEANRAKSEFLAVISHELRTPLSAIMGYTGLLTEGVVGPLTEEQEKHVVRIDRNSQTLLELIDQILDYTKLERDALHTREEPVPLDVLLDDLKAVVGPVAAEKGLRFEVAAEEALPEPVADEGRVRQILLNLLLNGVKYTQEGEVRLGVTHRDGVLFFRVEDTGVGIAPQHRERVFDPFWQVDQSATRGVGGVGLGLSISRRLARRMGGDVTLEAPPGGGSAFTLELPVLRPPA